MYITLIKMFKNLMTDKIKCLPSLPRSVFTTTSGILRHISGDTLGDGRTSKCPAVTSFIKDDVGTSRRPASLTVSKRRRFADISDVSDASLPILCVR